MKIIVSRASVRSGKEVLRQELEAGHIVTAFLRDPARLTIEHPALRMEVGDALELQAVSKSVSIA